MLITRGVEGGGGVEHDAKPEYAAQLMDLGCLSPGLSVSQQCLIALLSGVWFTCTWTLSQEFLYKARMWGRSANVNWGVGVGDRSSGRNLGPLTLPNGSQGWGAEGETIFQDFMRRHELFYFYFFYLG